MSHSKLVGRCRAAIAPVLSISVAAALAFSATAVWSTSAQALDLSLISGVYKQEKNKTDGAKAGGSNAVSAGARVGDRFTAHQGWFTDGKIVLKSFEGGDGAPAPDNYTGLSLAGGYRYYLMELNKQIVPYLGAAGAYETDKTVQFNGASNIETTSSGLYYRAFLGLRFDLDRDFFFELENYLFKSALFATEKQETRSNTTSSKSERTRMELFADSPSSLITTLLVFGFKI